VAPDVGIAMYVIGIPSEGRRSADYERGSCRSKKQIFHGTVLSFGAALVRRQTLGQASD
jgi:hypothetical protein